MSREKKRGSKVLAAKRNTRRRRDDLKACLEDVVADLRRYVVFSSPAHARLLALWIAHCHGIDAANATPIVHVYSPTPEAGKTTLLEVLRELLPEGRGLLDVDMSTASLYRLLGTEDAGAPAPYIPLLDEADAIFRVGSERAEALRPILNAGYRRGLCVTRCLGNDHTPTRFYVFGPKLLAGLATDSMPATILSRRLPIAMRRRLPDETVERYKPRKAQLHLHQTRDALAAAIAVSMELLVDSDPAGLDFLGDRQIEISEPLVAIADLAGPKWSERTRQDLAEVFDAPDSFETTAAVTLLAHIRDVFRSTRGGKVFGSELIAQLRARDDAPWSGWELNQRRLAQMLKPYGIQPGNVRIGAEQRKGYQREQFLDSWRRYCTQRRPGLVDPEEESRPSQRPKNSDSVGRRDTRDSLKSAPGTKEAGKKLRVSATTHKAERGSSRTSKHNKRHGR